MGIAFVCKGFDRAEVGGMVVDGRRLRSVLVSWGIDGVEVELLVVGNRVAFTVAATEDWATWVADRVL